jgi:hypothetical protein
MTIIPQSTVQRTTPTAPVCATRLELGTTGTTVGSSLSVGASEPAGGTG